MTQIRWKAADEEYMSPGHLACPGCGERIALRHALKVLGEKTVLVIPACCSGVCDGPFPYSSARVPLLHMAFEAAAAAATGVRAALDMQGDEETTVVAWAGDGGTFDIGLQALSGAVERNENFIYVCYDNEAYMNTGIQRSSATPMGAWTMTTPRGSPKSEPKKNLIEIMAAHSIPYAATASIAFPEDLMRKVSRAKEIKGTKVIHILAPCPTGWRSSPDMSVKVARLAVQTKVFPLYEVEGGEFYTVNYMPPEVPVSAYLSLQGRFSHLSAADVSNIQARVDKGWKQLMEKAHITSPYLATIVPQQIRPVIIERRPPTALDRHVDGRDESVGIVQAGYE